MEIRVAQTAGFCFGVERAVEKVYDQAGKKNVYTYGPIIHNEAVVEDLKKKGVGVIESMDELNSIKEGTIIIRSHGVEKSIYDFIEQKGLQIIDATCPFVKKIHKIVWEKSGQDNQIVIIGSDKHPEVEGIKGWCQSTPIVVETVEEAENLVVPKEKNVCIVSQTTFNYKKFQDLVEIISKKGYDINVFNTICNATEERQTEARAISKEVDAMIVIGGRSSSNTQKLYEISKRECANTYYIQTLDDFYPK